MKKPSDLDKRAAKEFQALATESPFFPVECRFRLVVRTKCAEFVEGKEESYTRIAHELWPKGVEEFKKYFGNGASFFAGALEYVRLATGWKYPYPGLLITVLSSKKQTSGGVAFYPPGLSRSNKGEIRINWADGEFTLTVLHELVHLFRRGREEDWVEQQALRLTMGV